MYIPTYKQVLLFIVSLVVIVVSIVKLSHVHDTSRSAITHSGDARASGSLPVSMPLVKTKQALVDGQKIHGASAHEIWYLRAGRDEQERAKLLSELSMSAFCERLKDIASEAGGIQRVANALWYLSLDESRFAQFRSQRIDSYDEELEDAVAKGMRYVIERILKRFGHFGLGYNNFGNIPIFSVPSPGPGSSGSVRFEMPDPRLSSDIKSISVFIRDNGQLAKKNVWIHQVWHALRVGFPALKSLHLLKDPHHGRELTVKEIKSAGRCVGVEKLGIYSCIGAGQLRHLKGSAVGNSVRGLVMLGLVPQDPDVNAISSFNVNKLSFYHSAVDAHHHSLARLLGNSVVADRLTALHVMFVQGTGTSAKEARAIAGLKNVKTLSLQAKQIVCKGCIASILNGMPISTKLQELVIAFPEISPADIDAVVGISVKKLSLACVNVTGEHISKIGAGAAGKSITTLELRNVEVGSVFKNLAALERLTSLYLGNYMVPGHPWYDLDILLAGTKQVKRLELVNKRLHSPIMMLVAGRPNLEELNLTIEDLSGSQLHTMLINKWSLRTLEITGGNVTGAAVGMIPKLHSLATLKLRNVTMSYDDVVALVDGGSLQRKLQRKFRLHANVPLLDGQRIETLRKYGLEYSNGVVIG